MIAKKARKGFTFLRHENGSGTAPRGREKREKSQTEKGEEMSKFITELDARLKDNDRVWILDSPLIYQSDMLGKIEVPAGFETDFASVPRVPIAYMFYGDRAHREAVIHDYLYRCDSSPKVAFSTANDVFFEAMKCRGKNWFIRFPMFLGVKFGGYSSYHKKRVGDKL